jgi:phospholipid/cholesterol/gamma-HCH transport system substrate-binding protein
MTESGTKIASKFETISGNGIEISAQTVELLKKANTLADDLKDLMKEAKGAVSKIKNPDKIFPDVQLEADVSRQTRPGHTRTDINMRVPFGHETYLVGLYDAFESNKLNVQMVKTFNPRLDLRYGVYASKPGIGVDYRLAPNLWVRSDAFGLNETQFDLRARYDFGGGLSGWIGLERIFQDNSPAIGIGFRR